MFVTNYLCEMAQEIAEQVFLLLVSTDQYPERKTQKSIKF